MQAIVNDVIIPLYSSPEDPWISDELLCGMTVQILQSTNDWYEVQTQYNYTGFVPKAFLHTDPHQIEHWQSQDKYFITSNFADLLTEPKTQGKLLHCLTRGCQVIKNETCVDPAWSLVTLPNKQQGYTRTAVLQKNSFSAIPEEQLRNQLVETAFSYIGAPYRWGGKTPLGIDCSGLCFMSYFLNGIDIFRDSQIKEGFPIQLIPEHERKKGDLIYFTGHIAMYIGNNQYIHSTATGNGVRINSLNPTDSEYRKDLSEALLCYGGYKNAQLLD